MADLASICSIGSLGSSQAFDLEELRKNSPSEIVSLQEKPNRDQKSHKTVGAPDRPWHMRAWTGMGVRGWWVALARHQFRISPTRLPMACILSCLSCINSVLASLQWLTYRRRIAETKLVADPVFVVGHWRAGTTLLHELLVLDSEFTYPNTYACFSPNHFLITESWLKGLIGVFLPRQRPMDNMAIGWDLPQEDEWALCNMGLPSPYLKIMFPNLPVQDRAYQDLQTLPTEVKKHWQARLHWLLKSLTVREPKQIVLKTPVHTFRVRALLEIFPNARFIHITRDPFVVFPSTIHTWRKMYRFHGLQVPKFEFLEQEVLQTFSEMYEVFEKDKSLLKPDQFCQLSYEKLVEDPVRELTHIYDQLQLPIRSEVHSRWKAYADRTRGYTTNRYQLSQEQRSEIAARWAGYFENYGYDKNED